MIYLGYRLIFFLLFPLPLSYELVTMAPKHLNFSTSSNLFYSIFALSLVLCLLNLIMFVFPIFLLSSTYLLHILMSPILSLVPSFYLVTIICLRLFLKVPDLSMFLNTYFIPKRISTTNNVISCFISLFILKFSVFPISILTLIFFSFKKI